MKSIFTSLITFTALAGAVLGSPNVANAHEGDESPTTVALPMPAATLVQLEDVRRTAARFFDVAEAEKAGYVDISVFYPNMGWHYLNPDYLDDRFEAGKPELLVYADDPCGGKRRLVAVEYAVPVAQVKAAPQGFVGGADVWTVNSRFQLWTLHAWIYEYNPHGVFAAFNPRVE